MTKLMTSPPTDVSTTHPVIEPDTAVDREDDIGGPPSQDKSGQLDDGGAVGGPDEGAQQRPVGQLYLDTTCEYRRGGNCLVHGPGATRKFKGGYKVTIGEGGVRTKRYVRSYYYVCDHGRGGQIQSRLSFKKMTSSISDARNSTLNTTSKEGQNGNSTTLG